MLMEAKYDEGVRAVVTDVEQAPPSKRSKGSRNPTFSALHPAAKEALQKDAGESASDADGTIDEVAGVPEALINPFASNKGAPPAFTKDLPPVCKAAPDTARVGKRKMPVVGPAVVKTSK